MTTGLFATPPYFCWKLAFYRHLPTSGRQNTVKTAPQPLLVNRAFVALNVTIISPVGPFLISLFVFEPRGQSKQIPFFTNYHFALVKKVRRPASDSILMPPTFPIASLNRYTPNFSGVPQKLTWCQQFGLQIFPK